MLSWKNIHSQFDIFIPILIDIHIKKERVFQTQTLVFGMVTLFAEKHT
jgi:hypothetical protein